MSRETLDALTNAAHVFLHNNAKIDALREALAEHEAEATAKPKAKAKAKATDDE